MRTNNPLEEFKEAFSNYPEIIEALEKKLAEREEELISFCQINGDHLHYSIASKGPTYWYSIWVKDKYGNEPPMIRICNYLDPNKERGLIFRSPNERN